MNRDPIAARARLRMFRLVPVDIPPPGTVASADLHTSMCDARAALTFAMGDRPDVDGYPNREAEQLELFGVAA